MTEEEFWNLIKQTRPDPYNIVDHDDNLFQKISHLPLPEIFDYGRYFHAAMSSVYTKNICRASAVIYRSMTDDGFEGFAAALIAQGKATIDAVRRDPESLLDLGIQVLEQLQGGAAEGIVYLPQSTYLAKVYGDPDCDEDVPDQLRQRLEPPVNGPADFELDRLHKDFPKLAAAFSGKQL